ncbi:hypothetical protein [Mesorhizobium sp. CN2-181]|uniref:hypothetical protein n=1 Tax=Mesorhizobium yinganensis TaxID=3157707 RepID=UPI0032B85EDC
MNDAEIRRIVSETVDETLTKLGVDPNNPLEFQKDMAHIRAWRNSVETVKTQSLTTAIGIITAGIVGLIWMAISKSTP